MTFQDEENKKNDEPIVKPLTPEQETLTKGLINFKIDSLEEVNIDKLSSHIGRLITKLNQPSYTIKKLTFTSINLKILTKSNVDKLLNFIGSLKHLKMLDILDSDLSSTYLRTLAAALEKSKTIENINLSGNKIGDNGLIALTKLVVKNPSIKHVNLSKNNISNEGLKVWLNNLTYNRNLESFNFDNNRININKEISTDFRELLVDNKLIKNITVGAITQDPEIIKFFNAIVSVKAKTREIKLTITNSTHIPSNELDSIDNTAKEVIEELKSSLSLLRKNNSYVNQNIGNSMTTLDDKQKDIKIVTPEKNYENEINLLNKYNIFPSSSEKKAIVILGTYQSGKTTLANLLKYQNLKVAEDDYGKIIILTGKNNELLVDKSSSSPVINLINANDTLICDSNYSNTNAFINNFFLQKIVNNFSTKFIILVKETSLHEQYNFLSSIREYVDLLSAIDLPEKAVSLVAVGSPTNKKVNHVSKFIDDIRLSDDMTKKFLELLKKSIYVFHAPQQVGEYKGEELLPILEFNENFLKADKNNKISIKSELITEEIIGLKNHINEKLKTEIKTLGQQAMTKWSNDLKSIFITKDYVIPNTKDIKSLVTIFKLCESDGPYKNFDDFSIICSDLCQTLNDQKSKNILNNYIEYVKYFSQMNFEGSQKSYVLHSAGNSKEWFEILSAIFPKPETVKAQIVESFRDACLNKNNPLSLLNKISANIQKCYENVKGIKYLNKDELEKINNLKTLKLYFEHAANKNLVDLQEYLLNIVTITTKNDVSLISSVKNNIGNLHNLIGDQNEVIAQSLWKEIIQTKNIQEVNNNINLTIYSKLLKTEIKENTIKFYESLLSKIEETNSKINLSNSPLKNNFNIKISDLCYNIGNMAQNAKDFNKAKDYYQKAIEVNDSKCAAEKLGDLEYVSKNYDEAWECYLKTECVSKVKNTFDLLTRDQMNGRYPYDNKKLIKLLSDKAKYLYEHLMRDEAIETLWYKKKLLLEFQAPQKYQRLAEVCDDLVEMASPNNSPKIRQLKNEAAKYREQANLEESSSDISAFIYNVGGDSSHLNDTYGI